MSRRQRPPGGATKRRDRPRGEDAPEPRVRASDVSDFGAGDFGVTVETPARTQREFLADLRDADDNVLRLQAAVALRAFAGPPSQSGEPSRFASKEGPEVERALLDACYDSDESVRHAVFHSLLLRRGLFDPGWGSPLDALGRLILDSPLAAARDHAVSSVERLFARLDAGATLEATGLARVVAEVEGSAARRFYLAMGRRDDPHPAEPDPALLDDLDEVERAWAESFLLFRLPRDLRPGRAARALAHLRSAAGLAALRELLPDAGEDAAELRSALAILEREIDAPPSPAPAAIEVAGVPLRPDTDWDALALDVLRFGVPGAGRDEPPLGGLLRFYGRMVTGGGFHVRRCAAYARCFALAVAQKLTASDPLVRHHAISLFASHPAAPGAWRVDEVLERHRALYTGRTPEGGDLEGTLLLAVLARARANRGRALALARAELTRPRGNPRLTRSILDQLER